VIKATLDFTLASMGSKDRLSLVTFEVGQSGRVRRTPFLSVTKAQSRQRLEKFIDEIGVRVEEAADEFLVRGSKDEKTDVVTAVNHGVFSLGKIFYYVLMYFRPGRRAAAQVQESGLGDDACL
jgi:hypothetical protein